MIDYESIWKFYVKCKKNSRFPLLSIFAFGQTFSMYLSISQLLEVLGILQGNHKSAERFQSGWNKEASHRKKDLEYQ